jgi:hypothetical protein
LRAEHHAVDNEGVLVAEELRDADPAAMAFEAIVFGNSAAGWKGAAKCGDALDVAPELDVLGEEGVASLTVFWALVGEGRFVLFGKFCCGDESVVGHSVLLDETSRASDNFDGAEALRSRISAARSSIRPRQQCFYQKVRGVL